MAQNTFGTVDKTQLEDARRLLDETAARYVENLRLKAVVDQDLTDKMFSTKVHSAYASALGPKKIKRYDPKSNAYKEVDVFPSDQEVLNAATEAKSKLGLSAGRHSQETAKRIDTDVANRAKFKRTDPKRQELDWYIETYGMDDGLTRYNQVIGERTKLKGESQLGVQGLKNEGALAVQEARNRGARELQDVKSQMQSRWVKGGEPGRSEAGTVILKLFNTFTGEGKVWDSGIKEIAKAGAGSSDGKLKDALGNLGALESTLGEYQTLLQDVDSGRIGGLVAKGAALIGQNDSARAANGMQQNLASFAARVLNGERGVLTNQDIDRALALIPVITDTESERALKFNIIDKLIKKRKEAMQKGYDGSIHIPEMNDVRFAPEYGDIGWDKEDSQAYLQEYNHWPSYQEAIQALTEAER